MGCHQGEGFSGLCFPSLRDTMAFQLLVTDVARQLTSSSGDVSYVKVSMDHLSGQGLTQLSQQFNSVPSSFGDGHSSAMELVFAMQ